MGCIFNFCANKVLKVPLCMPVGKVSIHYGRWVQVAQSTLPQCQAAFADCRFMPLSFSFVGAVEESHKNICRIQYVVRKRRWMDYQYIEIFCKTQNIGQWTKMMSWDKIFKARISLSAALHWFIIQVLLKSP